MCSTRTEHRLLEPISDLLRHQLRIPQIYFDVCWPVGGDSRRIDVLAVDHAGIGDAHIVEIKDDARSAWDAIPNLLAMPAHYRWIAFYEDTVTPVIKARIKSRQDLDPSNGPGRIGVITIVRSAEDKLEAKIVVYAERFHGLKYSKIEEYLKGLEPDIYTKD